MKTLHKIILLVIIIVFFGCFSSKHQNIDYSPNFIEKRLSFFDPYSSPWPDSNFTYKEWIRKPENIKIVHETFKKVGYSYLVNCNYFEEWNSLNRPLNQRVDSLIITYKQDSVSEKYYREFWTRRKFESNDSIVFQVLIELHSILGGQKLDFDLRFVNDTLTRLLEIKFSEDSLTLDIAQRNFDYLKSIGFHQSAYNILTERYAYYNINWNIRELEKSLIIDTTRFCFVPWIQDDTK